MRTCAIDCGTNTILCLVAEDPGPGAIYERAEIVRLGEGLDASGQLRDDAMARTLAVLAEYVDKARELECAHVLAVGTEALRRASNGHVFVNEATRLLGTVGGRFQIIDGEREAKLSWRAVRASFPELVGTRTVVDIGGGSTELLVGDAAVDELISLPIGSVRLTERLIHSDPPAESERSVLIATIDRALDGAPRPRGQVVGIAGTVTTLSAIALGLTQYDGDRVHGSRLDLQTLRAIIDRLAAQPVADRRRTPGLDPKRADVIYAGAVILERIMARAGVGDCLVSDRGIRWGLVYEAAGLGG
jgi:exopolyphosphatase/guanosine-5'-triphosphate,3'-diphosphate pyrophosphatase